MPKLIDLSRVGVSHVPGWTIGLLTASYLIIQIVMGSSVFAALTFSFAIALTGITFNVLGGFKTISGWFLIVTSIYPVIAPALFSIFSGIPLSQFGDPDEEVFLMSALASACVLLSAYLVQLMPFHQSRGFLEGLSEDVEKATGPRIAFFIAMIAIVLSIGIIPIPTTIRGVASFLTPFSCIAITSCIRKNMISSRIGGIMLALLVLANWKEGGLSGMKIAIMTPLFYVGSAMLLSGLKVSISTLLLTIFIFTLSTIVAVALQPLRSFESVHDKQMRSALALALLDCDFENRFGFSLPIHVPDLVAQAVAHECRKHLQQSNSQHGMLKRMTLLEDDTKMVLATQSQGFIPISKYFEEMIIIPRVFSGTYVLDDKISAFYGRYSGSIGRKNFTTGVAFNGFILAYAHGGYGVAILFTVSAALALFILLPMVFGQSIRNLVAQSFLLTNGIESMISVHFVFYIVSRGLLNTVGGILVVYALMRITSGRKTPPETLERLSSSATN